MKYQEKNYTFDASARTITFDAWTTIDLTEVLLITDMTLGIIIFDFSKTDKRGSVATNVLTLNYDTSLHADIDQLQILMNTELETKLDETTNATYTYVGKAVPGAASSAPYWQIFRFESSGDLNKKFADSNDDFDNIWDNRDSLAY